MQVGAQASFLVRLFNLRKSIKNLIFPLGLHIRTTGLAKGLWETRIASKANISWGCLRTSTYTEGGILWYGNLKFKGCKIGMRCLVLLQRPNSKSWMDCNIKLKTCQSDTHILPGKLFKQRNTTVISLQVIRRNNSDLLKSRQDSLRWNVNWLLPIVLYFQTHPRCAWWQILDRWCHN